MADYSTEVLADSPTVFLKTDEASGNLADSSGNSRTGTVSGSALTYRQAGPGLGIPYGVKFNVDGTSLVSIADSVGVDLGDGPFTIEFWLKRVETGESRGIIRKYSASGGYRVQINSNTLRLQIGSGSNNVRTTTADTDTTNWHHWVLTRGTSASGKAYRDGVDDTTVSGAQTFSDNNDALELNPSGVYFAGYVAALAIYKSELSAARVSAHYAAYNTAAGGSGRAANRRGMLGIL